MPTKEEANTGTMATEELFGPQTPNEADAGLPPRDTGRAAWIVLSLLCSVLMVTWGFGSASGVFREYYFNHEPLAGNQAVASLGVLIVGILQVMSPFLLRFLSGRWHMRKNMMWAGMILVVASTVGAAFSTTPLQVIMTQGLLYGVGSGLIFAPSVSFIDEWFLARRGLANGLFFGSNNIAAAGFSPIFAVTLTRFGPKAVLIAWAIFGGVIMSIGIFFVRSRASYSSSPPKTEGNVQNTPISWKAFNKPLFYLFALSMLLQGLSNFLPAAYLPSYATDMGMSAEKGGLLITCLSLAGMIGQSLLGALTDAVGPLIPLLLSTLVSTFSVLVLWGWAGHGYWIMVILAILFGAFSFSFVVVRSHMAAAVVGDEDRPDEETVISGALLAVRGTAAVASGYIGAAVMSAGESVPLDPQKYGGGKWLYLIVTIGSVMFCATIGALGLLGKRGRLGGKDS